MESFLDVTDNTPLSDKQVMAINLIKAKGKEILDIVELLKEEQTVDELWLRVGKVDIAKGLMSLVHAISKAEGL